jgi:hypothetical protein
MKSNFSRAVCVLILAIFCTVGILAQDISPENSQIRQIKISGSILAAMKNGDYVYPKFSPDGKLLAYSNVLVEETENTEVGLLNLQKQSKSILLNSKQAKKYAVYAAFVADLEWLAFNKLRARISDGDVDSTILTFNTQTRRVVKTEYSSTGDDTETSAEISPLAKTLYKTFPHIERDYIGSAIDMNQAFKIGNRGTVVQYSHADTDANIWFLDFQTKQPKLLLESPKDAERFYLKGAFEVTGNLLILLENKNEMHFYLMKNGKIEQIGKTAFGGLFEPKFSTRSKLFFMLKQPNNESDKPSSLWYFDGQNLSMVSDVENLCDVDIDRTGKVIAFCYWNKAGKRDVSVRKIKAAF